MKPLLDIGPVRKVQEAYFQMLRELFATPFDEMKKHGISPGTIASDMASRSRMVAGFNSDRAEILSSFEEFWETNQSIVDKYLKNLEAVKSFFGGDISPIAEIGHISSTLLYTDTLVLQCPVLRVKPFIEFGPPDEALRLLAKHALNVMQLEDLALADVEPPILLVTGCALSLDENYSSNFIEVSEPYVLAQAKALTDRTFANAEELQKFVFGIKTIPEAIATITNTNRALFDTDWSDPLEEQFRRNIEEISRSIQLPDGANPVGFAMHSLISGRMLQANEIVLLNSSIGASPLLTAPTSWQYLLWRYEFDAQATNPEADPRDLLITNAILTRDERNEVPLLSGLSTKSIVALRKEGAMASLRELIRSSIIRIDTAVPSELKAISLDVARKLSEAFDSHDRDLSALKSSKKRFYGIDVASSIATGALTITAAATGNVPLTTIGALAALLLGSKSALNMAETWKTLKAEDIKIKRSPAAILLRNLDK